MEKKCKICEVVKPVETGFLQSSSYTTPEGVVKYYYRGECIECNNNKRRGQNNEYHKEYKQRPEVKARRAAYKRQEGYKAKQRVVEREKYATDPLYNLKKRLRVRILYALKVEGWADYNKTAEIVGCSYEQFREHISSQFHSGMTWENHASLWEIEHEISMGLAITEEEMYQLCNYKNIRPMLIEEHKKKSIEDVKEIIIRKSNKII